MADVVLRDLYRVGYSLRPMRCGFSVADFPLRIFRCGFSVALAPIPTPLLFQFEHHVLHVWAVAITHAVRRLL
jgi:hypothetical protein